MDMMVPWWALNVAEQRRGTPSTLEEGAEVDGWLSSSSSA